MNDFIGDNKNDVGQTIEPELKEEDAVQLTKRKYFGNMCFDLVNINYNYVNEEFDCKISFTIPTTITNKMILTQDEKTIYRVWLLELKKGIDIILQSDLK